MENLPPSHPPLPTPKTGVLLLNLGTPESTSFFAVRRYLAEFLSDHRVIDAPRWFWLPLLHGVILTTRPHRSAHAYRKIWNHERNESPLKTITRATTENLARELAHPNTVVTWAMRYGHPSIKTTVDDLIAQGCTRIVALALYPQYSATTTASAYDALFSALQSQKKQPAVTTLGPYYDHPLYIAALAQSVTQGLQALPSKPEAIVASFHGLPKRYFEQGDPYHCHCMKTSRLLRESLAWPEDQWHTSFQSRFGPSKWLEPYTSDTIARLAAEGKKHIAVISPGFAADCIETLEELNIGLHEQFLNAGGETFTYIPCLNDTDAHTALLSALITPEI